MKAMVFTTTHLLAEDDERLDIEVEDVGGNKITIAFELFIKIAKIIFVIINH